MICKSDNIDRLAAALSGLQGELHDAYKGSKGYGYDYADLAAVFEVIRPLLIKHELSVSQLVSGSNNIIELNTMLMHSSGQYLSSTIHVSVDFSNKKMNSLQAAGSTVTYLRRYCLCSIIGIATTDDDGKAGGDSLDHARQQVKSKRDAISQPAIKHIAQDYTSEQLDQLHHQLMVEILDKQIPEDTVHTWCSKAGVQSVNQLSGDQTVKALKFIRERLKIAEPKVVEESIE